MSTIIPMMKNISERPEPGIPPVYSEHRTVKRMRLRRLFTIHYSTVHCSLFTVHCSLFAIHCLLTRRLILGKCVGTVVEQTRAVDFGERLHFMIPIGDEMKRFALCDERIVYGPINFVMKTE